MSPTAHRPRVAVANDYEVVVAGLAAILEPYREQVDVVDAFTVDEVIDQTVDIALYDTFGRQGVEESEFAKLLAKEQVRCVAVYSFNFDQGAVKAALRAGAVAYLSKATPAEELAAQLVRISEGETVVSGPRRPGPSSRDQRGWPGQEMGLSEREAEVVALAALGRRNAEIADALFVSVDTVKTHLSRSFRKLGVHNRTELSAEIHRRPSFRRVLPVEEG